MDTPESPTQSPQSPEEEEEKGLSDSELLDSADEEDRVNSDSEIFHEEENGGLAEEYEEEAVDDRGRGLGLEEEGEEEDEVVPDFVSDPEDEEPLGERGGMGQEDETILLMEGDDDGPQGGQLDGDEEEEEEEGEDKVIDTPQSPDSEQGRSFIAEEDGEDGDEDYGNYRKETSAEPGADMDDEEEEDRRKEEEDERKRAEERRRAAAAREMKDDSASVSRELDEHELDYDEEVPEEPSIPVHDEEEDEEDVKAEADEEEESEDKPSKRKEKKPILPPSPKDGELRRTDDSKGPERVRRDSFRDKKKEEDDGEIDEGEIDVSYCLIDSYMSICLQYTNCFTISHHILCINLCKWT